MSDAPDGASDSASSRGDSNGNSNDSSSSETPGGGSKNRRRRGSRGGRNRRKRPIGEGSTSSDNPTRTPSTRTPSTRTPVEKDLAQRPDDLPDRPQEDHVPTGGHGGTSKSDDAGESQEQDSKSSSRRRSNRGNRGGRGRTRTSEDTRKGRERKGRPVGRYSMCVHVLPGATQIAVLEGRNLVEHYVSRPQDDVFQIHGNIYLGRVQNVLPGMEAAFVDIGTPKNAVLYRGDVQYDAEDLESDARHDKRIEQMLHPNQTLICQVTKNPIGTKGARLTQDVSLPGRFVVLVPNQPDTYGISKRLNDDERRRLRRILDEIKPKQHGLIVRTAAEGATADELTRDVTRLVTMWEGIDAKAKRGKAPDALYREPDMAVRIIREEFNRDYRSVIIDDESLYTEVRDYVASISPELADRVEYYDTEANSLPMFERFHVHEQVHKGVDRKVWLPSGGSLIIERTEALTVIDVNTGKNVGKSSLEETVYRNNLEAADEIARQLRLRDIGGIIVIDFIDMEIMSNRDEVVRAFRDALSRDKTRTQVFNISELGLVEMTRKRISEGLVESLSAMCPNCEGRGFVFDEALLGERAIGAGVIAPGQSVGIPAIDDEDELDEESSADESLVSGEIAREELDSEPASGVH